MSLDNIPPYKPYHMPRKAYDILKKYAMRSLAKEEPSQKTKKQSPAFSPTSQSGDDKKSPNKKRMKMDGKDTYKVDVQSLRPL